MSSEIWLQAKELYVQGVSKPEIAQRLGVTVEQIKYRIRHYGWAALKPQVLPVVRANKDGEGNELREMSNSIRLRLARDTARMMDALESTPIVDDVKKLRARENVLGSLTKRAESVFGWSTQDAVVGVITVGYASRVLGDGPIIARQDTGRVVEVPGKKETGAA